jgi:BirA family biotin operon repressor/biotin-[acetyl-CoA-carboxylase] ligase
MGIHTANWPQLSLTTAVAVCDVLQKELDVGWAPPTNKQARSTSVGNAHPTPGIKWPNDVLLDGRKICGILIESPGGAAPAKNRLIIGIGININNSWRLASSDVDVTGTALCDLTGRQHDLQTMLAHILDATATRLAQFRRSDPELTRAWQELDLRARQHTEAEIL